VKGCAKGESSSFETQSRKGRKGNAKKDIFGALAFNAMLRLEMAAQKIISLRSIFATFAP